MDLKLRLYGKFIFKEIPKRKNNYICFTTCKKHSFKRKKKL